MMAMTDGGKQAKAEYMKKWREKNPTKNKINLDNYWERQADKLPKEKRTRTKRTMSPKSNAVAVSISEAGEMLGIGKALTYKMVREGELPSVKIGQRRIVIPLEAIENLLKTGNCDFDNNVNEDDIMSTITTMQKRIKEMEERIKKLESKNDKPKEESILNIPIENLSLNTAAYNSLKKSNINVIGEITSKTRNEIEAMKGMGPASVKNVEEKLKEHGISFRKVSVFDLSKLDSFTANKIMKLLGIESPQQEIEIVQDIPKYPLRKKSIKAEGRTS